MNGCQVKSVSENQDKSWKCNFSCAAAILPVSGFQMQTLKSQKEKLVSRAKKCV